MSRDIHRRSVRIEHGPREFYYSSLPDGRPHPVIQCLCMWFPPEICDTWQQAGEAFDNHIAAALRKETAEYIEATVGSMAALAAAAKAPRKRKGKA